MTGQFRARHIQKMAIVKQISAGRRRPGMTHGEYLNYHFKVHGQIADGVENLDEKPAYV